MSQENVKLIQSVYEGFGRGDMSPFMAAIDPNVEWNEPDAPGYPYPGTHSGMQAVMGNVFAPVGSLYDDFSLVPQEFVDGGDKVFVLGEFSGKGKETGKPFKAHFVHVFTFRDGKAVQYRNYTDSGAIAAALS